jgi:GNAT superfamily N-acetyltransferase
MTNDERPTTNDQLVDIRIATPGDAADAARLSGELGYPIDADTMGRRIQRLLASPDHGVFIAVTGGRAVGWIQVAMVQHLQSEVRAEIGGLVVSAGHRGTGIGAKLVARAEQWGRDRGLAGMVVRSQITRENAHRFYLREGYARTKTSAVFSKELR